jgi:hypothetical protein
MHSRNDSRETTRAARDKFDERFIDEVDPDRVLPEAERLRRAAHARKAYFTVSRSRPRRLVRRRSRHESGPAGFL